MSEPKKPPTRDDARKGGLATKANRGPDWFKELGRLGGLKKQANRELRALQQQEVKE